MAISTVTGRRLDTQNIGRLIDDALATIAEFGEPGADAQQVFAGPLAEPEAQRDFANRGLARTARRLAAQSPFYARRFAAAGAQPRQLDVDGVRAIPVTTKQDLTERPGDFRCTDVAGYLTTRTTGTTGRPALAGFIVFCLADWVLVQDLGFFGGLGTDPNSMIPFALLAGVGYLALTRAPAPVAAEAPHTPVTGRARPRVRLAALHQQAVAAGTRPVGPP